MPLEDNLETSGSSGLELKVKTGFKDIWKQMTWKDKLLLAGTTLFSIATAGIATTMALNAVYLTVYKLLQYKAKQQLQKKSAVAEIHLANLSAPYMTSMYYYFNMLPSITAKMLVGFGLMIPFSLLLYFPIKHYLHNYTIKEFARGILNGKVIKDGYETIKNNFKRAYKKICAYLPIPLGLFWYFTPPAYQPLLHASLGGLGRIGMKAIVDKDIQGVYKKKA